MMGKGIKEKGKGVKGREGKDRDEWKGKEGWRWKRRKRGRNV